MKIVQVGFGFDEDLRTPEALLDRYRTLTGWSDALVHAGAGHVSVVQRFGADAQLSARGVDYVFRRCGRSWPLPLVRAVKALAPDVVHVNGLEFAPHASLLRMALPRTAAIVIQDHGERPAAPGARAGQIRRALRGLALRSVDGVLFCAHEQAEPFRATGLLSSGTRVFEVLEASTEIDQVAPCTETSVSGAPALLWVGRLDANKDPLTVLDGFERVLASAPAARLTMCFREAPILGQVQSRIDASAALRSAVCLAGFLKPPQLAAAYLRSDFFVSGSHHEGSGYALIEASATGLPAIVTDIPSFRRITGRGAFGVLWKPGDAGAFARAVLQAIAGPDAPRFDRGAIRQHFERHLSWRAVGREAMACYAEAVRATRVR